MGTIFTHDQQGMILKALDLTRSSLLINVTFSLQSPSQLLKGALTYFLGCVAKEYACGITWKFFAAHRSFYNTALVINIEIEQ